MWMNKRINLHRVLVITAILVIFLCLLFLTSCGRNETDHESVSVQDFTQAPEKFSLPKRIALNTYMNYSVLKGDRSGFVAMFSHNGTVIYENAVGWANLGLKKPMQLDTKMRFASMTKPITAVAALILIENQQLSLDDPVSKYIPE